MCIYMHNRILRTLFEISAAPDFNDIMHINKDFRIVYDNETRFLEKSMVPKLLNS